MSKQIQSSSVPLKISFDAGITFKDLVCLQNYNIESTTATTTDDTFCGRFVGVGPIASQITGTGVCEAQPLVTQVSIADMKNAQSTGMLVYIQSNAPASGSAGGAISNNGSGYVTAAGEQFAANNLVKFTFTILINGSLV